MKKCVVSLLLAAALTTMRSAAIFGQSAVLAIPAQQTDVQTEGDFQYTVSNGEATIVKYTGCKEDVTIPETLGGAPVTKIGDDACSGNVHEDLKWSGSYYMKKLTMPDTVTEIGAWAFSECSSLESIHFSSNLKIIHGMAFAGCAVKELELPDSLTELGDERSGGAFSLCPCLETVILPDNLSQFHLSDFDMNNTLRKVRLGKNTKTMDLGATRYDPDDLIAHPGAATGWDLEIEVPDGSAYFKSVDGVVYSKDGTELAFYPLAKSGIVYTVASGTQTIGQYAFADAYKIGTVILPTSLKTIKKCAFSNCSSLKEVAFPNGLESIQQRAFEGCTRLNAANLPVSVKTVEAYAFYSSEKMTVTVEGKNTAFEEGAFDINKATALCAKNSKAAKYFKKKNTKAKRIIYTLNGGVNHADNAYYFTRTRSLRTPYREGYRFVGWYTDKACTKKVIKATKGKSLHVYAKWAKL